MPDETKKPAKPKAQTVVVKGGQLVPKKDGPVTAPELVFPGDGPNVGDTLIFKLDNGVTYTGKAATVASRDGVVCVGFKNGIAPK